MTLKTRWRRGAIAAFVAFVALVTTHPLGPTFWRSADDIGQALAPLVVAAPACAAAARRSSGRARWAWALLAVYAACWGAGQLAWSYFDVVRGHPELSGWWPDSGYTAAALVAAAAVVVYPGERFTWRARLRALVDGLLVVTALLFTTWTAAVDAGAVQRSGATPAQEVIGLFYPGADIVLLALVLTVVARAGGGWRGPLTGVGACFLAMFAGDAGAVYLALSGGFHTGTLVDACWVAAFMVLAVSASEARAAPPDGTGPAAVGAGQRGSATGGEGHLAPGWPEYLPYGPAALALVMATAHLAGGSGFGVVEGTLMVASGALLAIRQLLFMAENRVLTAHLARSVQELEWLSLHDQLTGLPNRALFMDRLEQALRAARRAGPAFALAYLDIDDFKEVNDTFGHAAGDALLREFARRVTEAVRSTDTVARLAGDEFVMILPSCGDRASAGALVERALGSLAEPFIITGRPKRVNATAGVALSGAYEAEALLKLADDALYVAKSRGKGQVYVHSVARGPADLATPPAELVVPPADLAAPTARPRSATPVAS